MKKKIALPIIITSSVIAALLIAVLVLSFVYVNPLTKSFGGYSEIAVYDLGAENPYPTTEKATEQLESGIKSSRFSVMHAILEGRFNYSPRFKTEPNEDNEKERVTLTASGVKAVSSSETQYMLVLSYDEKKTVKVEGETVEFDRAKVLVYDTNGEIERIEVYPYLESMMGGNNIDISYYKAPVIEIWLTTSKLTSVLSDYKSLLK